MGLLDCLVLLEPLVEVAGLVQQVLLDPLACQALLGTVGKMARLVLAYLALLALLVPLAQLVSPVIKALLEPLVNLVAAVTIAMNARMALGSVPISALTPMIVITVAAGKDTKWDHN